MSIGASRHLGSLAPAATAQTAWLRRPLIWLDAARVAAALAIVWIHAPQSPTGQSSTHWARFAVPFFVATSLLLVFQTVFKNPARPLAEYVKSRIHRLYLPFLAWSGVYLAFKGVKCVVLPNQPNDFPGWEVFVVGGAYHLWFLPYLLIASVVTFLAARIATISVGWQWAVAAVGVGLGCVIAALAPASWPTSRYDALYFMLATTPAAFWAWAAAIIYQRSQHLAQPSSLPTMNHVESTPSAAEIFALCASGLVFIVSCVSLQYAGRQVWLENVAGIAAVAWTMVPVAPHWASRAKAWAELSFGVYLGHLLFIKIVEAVFGKLQVSSTVATDVATWAVAVVGATLLAYVCHRTSWARWLL
jgi:peptidoglycan/LPS O-acetylase OafA/YrhL